MGKLLKPRGINGVLWFLPFNIVDSSLKPGKCIRVKIKEGIFSDFFIESLNITKKKSWIKFDGLNSRDDVDALCGLEFFLERAEFNSISESEYYLVDLVGLSVFDVNQNKLGLVVDTMVLPSQNLIIVKLNKKEFMIPFVDAHISFFDIKKNIIILKDVEGIIDWKIFIF